MKTRTHLLYHQLLLWIIGYIQIISMTPFYDTVWEGAGRKPQTKNEGLIRDRALKRRRYRQTVTWNKGRTRFWGKDNAG